MRRLTLQECLDKIKIEYPKHYPYCYIEYEGKYVFNLVLRGEDPESAISDMHIAYPDTGHISGGISIIEFLKIPDFRAKWKHANLIAYHDESLKHSLF